MSTYTVQRVLNLYGSKVARSTVVSAEKAGLLPQARRKASGSVRVRYWEPEDLPVFGERYGFLGHFDRPLVVSVFTTKGGVLKTTLALNIGRAAALHNIRTCVVGLDLQGDITNALGFEDEVDDDTSDLDAALEKLNSTRGLSDLHAQEVSLESLIQSTDLPTLDFLPETPELAMLEQSIAVELRREYWLKDHVTEALKSKYELIVLDCGPNWNFLVTNALVACDALICPLECKINNYRNLKVFRSFTKSFRDALKLEFEQIFIPSRLASVRKLSTAIRAHYMQNIPGCTSTAIRESTQGEESMAAKLSLPEYAPKSLVADEMRELLVEIWARLKNCSGTQQTDAELKVAI